MECPHLEESARILEPNFKTENNPPEFVCSVCNTDRSPWICLACGIVNCGRYVNAHAKAHFEETEKHHVCMDCHNYMAFCYTCDEFVINDTSSGHLEKLRKSLESIPKLTQQSQNVQKHRKGRRCRGSTDSLENDRKRRKKDDKKLQRPPRTSGLRNLGNTCFMNAVLQSLSNIQHFCGYIKQLPSLEDKAVKIKKYNHAKKSRDLGGEDLLVVEELRKILVALWQGNKTAISPESLFTVIWKVVPRFRGYQQQDAHEFMRYLLDRLHSELLQLLPYPTSNSPFITPKGTSTIVTAIFGGLLQNEVHCLICGMESKKHDPFLDLSLDIPNQFAMRSGKPKEGEPVCRLSDCLHSFTDVEELEESELYYCGSCKRRQKSTKKFWIRRLPNVLCLHLKRFRWSTYCRVKVETFVEFPLTSLDMNCYVLNNLHETRGSSAGSNLYDLAAVVVHHGSGAGSGHYTSYAIHEGQWYHFNDSSVTACEPEVVQRCKAYILFYVRRQVRLPDYLTCNGGSAGKASSSKHK
ncbi:ubiquitin carboxyl-terminal hydrolase 3-like isoform X2 [Pomacea canaliculata]|uniref:ubiquitin carboxyl-terminal hydrolase 3-like isoform X2 n=1 Tax=Pomacea canaliculata TaxID=400727 RepID=UPI000D732490|nr:ubiquitin carboxyl-terminal hydrolase 3-like isoform X2 [Pomacea canaliculata]